MSDWKSIDNAPKGKSVFLGRWSENVEGNRFWEVGHGVISDGSIMVSGAYKYSTNYFTHYRELDVPQ